MWFSRQTIFAVIVGLLIGCGRNPAPTNPQKAGSTTPSITSSAEVSKERDAILTSIPGYRGNGAASFLDPILDRVEPSNDEWQTEVFSAAASQQLKRLADAVYHHDFDNIRICWEASVCDRKKHCLRPKPLETVYQDDAISIARQTVPSEENSTVSDAVHELLSGFKDGAKTKVKFKVFRVDQDDSKEYVSTDVYFNASGENDDGRVQQNAQWKIVWSSDTDHPLIRSVTVRDFEEIVTRPTGSIEFLDCTESVIGTTSSFKKQLARGVDHWRGKLEANYGVDPNGNQGIALGDVDGDGLDDVFVCQQGGLPNRLYAQNRDGTVRDVSREAGVDWMEVCRAALFVDLDNDGDQDLVMAQGWYLMIMTNDGNGKFEVALQRASDANLYSIAAADYDLDGDIDLFFCGRNPSRERGREAGILGTPIPYHDANNGGPNILLRNDGDRFSEVTVEVGLDVNNRRYSYAASWEDFDNDGDLDLYVANDFGRNNLYRNDRSENGIVNFVDIAAGAGVEDISAGMSITWGDYNRDGLMDAYVSNMFSSAGNRIAYQRQFRTQSDSETTDHFRRHARGNTLFANSLDGTFQDVSVDAAVTMGRWAWGAKFFDLNNDGWEDLYVTNGFITTDDTGDL